MHAYRALKNDKDNALAREVIGEKMVDGVWKVVREVPDIDEEETKVMAAARRSIGKDYDLFAKLALKKSVALAKRLEDVGFHDLAGLYWWHAILYDSSNEEALKARGYVEVDEVWVPSLAQDNLQRGMRFLKDASNGRPDQTEDEQPGKVGLTFTRRASNGLVVRTTFDTERAKRFVEVANATATFTTGLLDMKGKSFRSNPYILTVVGKRIDFTKMINNFEPQSAKRGQIAREATGHSTTNPVGYIVVETKTEITTDDMLSNVVASEILLNSRESAVSPWLLVGFPYYVTSCVLNTAITSRFEIKDGSKTRVYRGDRDKIKRGNPFAPEDFRLIIRDLVESKQDTPLLDLALLELNDFNEYHAAKAFAFVEFLFLAHTAKAKAWLRTSDQKGHKEIKALAKRFEKSVEELEAEFRAWVLKNY
ncbi:MAG: hypothetical protein KDB07_07000 [Planctomycetes bacterium]|nr:hypothetical protein [Planctomycetota bacterium]